MIKVLLISRKAARCGVADYGARVYNILLKSPRLTTTYAEIDGPNEYEEVFYNIQPDIVLYNYYPVILPWINDSFLQNKRHVKHIIIHHELGAGFTPDAIIDVDSTMPDKIDQNWFNSPRPLFENIKSQYTPHSIPIIGSCGFGFSDKNFPQIAKLVSEQFEQAIIRINMPFATFGDEDGGRAREEVRKMHEIIDNSGRDIRLIIDHNFLKPQELVEFLSYSDINLFLYDPHQTRSLSGSIDYALSARRPIGISRSWMFRHINWITPSILVDETPIKDIILNGIEALKPIYEKHTNDNFLNKYEYVITKIYNNA